MIGEEYSWGLSLWHVKQGSDGISWLCADHPYAFPGLPAHGEDGKAIEVNEPVCSDDAVADGLLSGQPFPPSVDRFPLRAVQGSKV